MAKLTFKAGNLELRQMALMGLLTQQMPAKALYRLRKIYRQSENELKEFVDLKNELILKHGKDGSMTPSMESWPAFVAEYNPIVEMDIELDLTLLETIENFGENVTLDVQQLDLLEGYVLIGEDVPKDEPKDEPKDVPKEGE